MKLTDLKLNPDNPRFIKGDKFKKLVNSLKDFPKMMELRPIVVDKDMMILGGNMRYRAMQELNMTEIPDNWVKMADKLTKEEQRRFIVEDNLPFGEWDWDLLGNNFEVGELLEWGFDEKDLKIEPEVEEDEVPEPPQGSPESVYGEIYQLGRHRLMCGDATKIEDVEKLMDGKKADMVFTDPPYGIDLDTDYSKIKGSAKLRKDNPDLPILIGKKWDEVFGDDKPFDARFLIDYAKEVFLWGADYYNDTLPNFGKDGSWFVWDKRSEETDVIIGNTFELCWSKNKHKRQVIRYKWVGILGMSGQDSNKRLHPTMKPVQVCTFFIKNYSKDSNIVLDLFGGSGSTLIACEQTNRTCYMMEIDPKYCDVIRKRYANFIGKGEEWQKITPQI